MFDGLTRWMRRRGKLGVLVPMAAAATLAIASTPAQSKPAPAPPPPPPTRVPPKPPPPPPPPPTVLAVNGKCPSGYVLLNPKSPVSQRICGRKVG
jgi:hypothetical protein